MNAMFDYLRGLAANNNREWYHAHKTEYQEANAQFEALVQELIFKIGETDGSILHNVPKDLTFRLVRDTRFSHDKSPYTPAFRAHIAAGGKTACSGWLLPDDPAPKPLILRRGTLCRYV